jgi:hypothetical protein
MDTRTKTKISSRSENDLFKKLPQIKKGSLDQREPSLL